MTAAKTARVKEIILPVENKEDWEKVDLEIKSSLRFLLSQNLKKFL